MRWKNICIIVLAKFDKRLSKLEKNEERDYNNIDASKGQINWNLEGIEDCWKLLNELKERIEVLEKK